MFAWKTNNQRVKLVFGTGSVDVGLEFIVRSFVDLIVSIAEMKYPYVQFVQLCVHGSQRE
jgi:hypothetical protein